MPVPGGSQSQPPPQPYMGDMAPMDSGHQTMMWQQNQYMVDSGIHSGSTTQAPSVSSKHGALDSCEDIDAPQQMMYDFDRGYTHAGFPQDPINGNIFVGLLKYFYRAGQFLLLTTCLCSSMKSKCHILKLHIDFYRALA